MIKEDKVMQKVTVKSHILNGYFKVPSSAQVSAAESPGSLQLICLCVFADQGFTDKMMHNIHKQTNQLGKWRLIYTIYNNHNILTTHTNITILYHQSTHGKSGGGGVCSVNINHTQS